MNFNATSKCKDSFDLISEGEWLRLFEDVRVSGEQEVAQLF